MNLYYNGYYSYIMLLYTKLYHSAVILDINLSHPLGIHSCVRPVSRRVYQYSKLLTNVVHLAEPQ